MDNIKILNKLLKKNKRSIPIDGLKKLFLRPIFWQGIVIYIPNTMHKIYRYLAIFFIKTLCWGSVAEEAERVVYPLRTMTKAERMPFYEKLGQRDGGIAQFVMERFFQEISTGVPGLIKALPDGEFEHFVTNYLVARKLFKDSFRVVFRVRSGSDRAESVTHSMVEHLPAHKMDDLILQALFIRYGAIAEPRERIRNQLNLLRIRSDENRGEFLPRADLMTKSRTLYPDVAGLPENRYYVEQTAAGPRYRVYTVEDCLYIPFNHPEFHGMFQGDVEIPAATWAIADLRGGVGAPDRYHFGKPKIKNGALFRKDRTLVQQEGLMVVARKPFSHCYLVCDYYRHPDFDQMCVEERGILSKSSVDMPGMQRFIDVLGGFEELDKTGIGFLPYRFASMGQQQADATSAPQGQQGLSISQARMLLPYLYLLADEDPAVVGSAIQLLEDIIVDAEDDIEVASAEETKAEAVQPQTIPMIGAGAGVELVAPVARGEDLTRQHAHRRREETTPMVPSEEEQKAKKIQGRIAKLEKIRVHFRRKAGELRHYSAADTEEMIRRLHTAFSHHGVVRTGATRIRGSHAATEVTDITSAGRHSVFLGLVRRDHKEGFGAGTLKAIIDDHTDRVINLLTSQVRAIATE